MAAWAVDLDVANGILPGYIMGLYFFTGYALRLQVIPCSFDFSYAMCITSEHSLHHGNGKCAVATIELLDLALLTAVVRQRLTVSVC